MKKAKYSRKTRRNINDDIFHYDTDNVYITGFVSMKKGGMAPETSENKFQLFWRERERERERERDLR